MEVFSPGTLVAIGPVSDPITAVLTHINIGPSGHVRYSVSWWGGDKHNEQWLEAFEVTHLNEYTARERIGFK